VVHPYFTKKKIPGFKKQEKEQARQLGGRQKPASGALPPVALKGDFAVEDIVVEAKCTEKKSFVLKYSELAKIKGIAFQQGKVPAFSIRFDFEPKHLLEERDWVVIPFKFLKELLCARRINNQE